MCKIRPFVDLCNRTLTVTAPGMPDLVLSLDWEEGGGHGVRENGRDPRPKAVEAEITSTPAPAVSATQTSRRGLSSSGVDAEGSGSARDEDLTIVRVCGNNRVGVSCASSASTWFSKFLDMPCSLVRASSAAVDASRDPGGGETGDTQESAGPVPSGGRVHRAFANEAQYLLISRASITKVNTVIREDASAERRGAHGDASHGSAVLKASNEVRSLSAIAWRWSCSLGLRATAGGSSGLYRHSFVSVKSTRGGCRKGSTSPGPESRPHSMDFITSSPLSHLDFSLIYFFLPGPLPYCVVARRDSRRQVTATHFRPNFVVDGVDAHQEDFWQHVVLGGTLRLRVTGPCSRQGPRRSFWESFCSSPDLVETSGRGTRAGVWSDNFTEFFGELPSGQHADVSSRAREWENSRDGCDASLTEAFSLVATVALHRCSMINIDPATGDCSGVALRVLAGYRRQRANILFGQFLARDAAPAPERSCGDDRDGSMGQEGRGLAEASDPWDAWVWEGMEIRGES